MNTRSRVEVEVHRKRPRWFVLGAMTLVVGIGVLAAGPLATHVGSMLGIAAIGSGGSGGGIPLQINHQGVIMVGGSRFNGTGQFRFALVDPDEGNSVWTNDGSNRGTSLTPTNAVALTVINGIYNVALGDTGLANMTTIPSTTFDDDNLVLRIWFDDGVGGGTRQLTPDHKLTSVPYAYRAGTAAQLGLSGEDSPGVALDPNGKVSVTGDVVASGALSGFGIVPIGSIIAWHKSLSGVPSLPDGWVECSGGTITDAESPLYGQSIPNLNSASGYNGGRFLRGSATSGEMQEASAAYTGPFIGCGCFLMIPNVIATVDGSYAVPIGCEVATVTQGGICDIGSYTMGRVRPVNMTVVWVMRIK